MNPHKKAAASARHALEFLWPARVAACSMLSWLLISRPTKAFLSAQFCARQRCAKASSLLFRANTSNSLIFNQLQHAQKMPVGVPQHRGTFPQLLRISQDFDL
jgi:hypothetical protein